MYRQRPGRLGVNRGKSGRITGDRVMQAAETASLQFSASVIHFVRYLRMKGFTVAPGETVDVFRALERLNLADETEVRLGLRTVLCSTRAEHKTFDALFAAF